MGRLVELEKELVATEEVGTAGTGISGTVAAAPVVGAVGAGVSGAVETGGAGGSGRANGVLEIAGNSTNDDTASDAA
jgi:hypothetical protein